MRRLVAAAVCCTAGGALAGPALATTPPPPPPPPKPVSLTIAKVRHKLVVVVKCKNLTNRNANEHVALDVRTVAPKGEYGVQSNGPGQPVAVHPYGGNRSTSGPATLRISIKHRTETFRFGLKAIKTPHRVRIRALNEAGQKTAFYSLRLRH
jgi:hypothetical protein